MVLVSKEMGCLGGQGAGSKGYKQSACNGGGERIVATKSDAERETTEKTGSISHNAESGFIT